MLYSVFIHNYLCVQGFCLALVLRIKTHYSSMSTENNQLREVKCIDKPYSRANYMSLKKGTTFKRWCHWRPRCKLHALLLWYYNSKHRRETVVSVFPAFLLLVTDYQEKHFPLCVIYSITNMYHMNTSSASFFSAHNVMTELNLFQCSADNSRSSKGWRVFLKCSAECK